MKLKCVVVVTTLSTDKSMCLSVGTSSDQNRSAVTFHKLWMIARRMTSNLSSRVYHFMTWKNAVNIFRFLTEFFVLLDRLKNYFDFYQQSCLACRIYWKSKEVS